MFAHLNIVCLYRTVHYRAGSSFGHYIKIYFKTRVPHNTHFLTYFKCKTKAIFEKSTSTRNVKISKKIVLHVHKLLEINF